MDLCHMSTRVHIVHPCPYRPPMPEPSTCVPHGYVWCGLHAHLCPIQMPKVSTNVAAYLAVTHSLVVQLWSPIQPYIEPTSPHQT